MFPEFSGNFEPLGGWYKGTKALICRKDPVPKSTKQFEKHVNESFQGGDPRSGWIIKDVLMTEKNVKTCVLIVWIFYCKNDFPSERKYSKLWPEDRNSLNTTWKKIGK